MAFERYLGIFGEITRRQGCGLGFGRGKLGYPLEEEPKYPLEEEAATPQPGPSYPLESRFATPRLGNSHWRVGRFRMCKSILRRRCGTMIFERRNA